MTRNGSSTPMLDLDERAWSSSSMDALYLATHEEMFKAPPPSDEDGLRPRETFRCSSLGRCMRYQILERAGTPKPAIDEDSLRRMDMGSQIHWIHGLKKARYGLMLGREVAIADADISLTGHIDLVWGGPVQEIPEKWRLYRKPDWIFFLEALRRRAREQWGDAAPVTVDELKTVASYGFRQMPRDGRSDQRTQLGGYAMLAERHPDLMPAEPERYQLVVFNRESGAMREIPMERAWVDVAAERLETLNAAWSSGSWPNCTCGATEDIAWERKLCPWPTDDGSGCCGQTFLEQLEASVEATR